MAGSAQRPKKPESRDGCVSRMRSLQLQSLQPQISTKSAENPPTFQMAFLNRECASSNPPRSATQCGAGRNCPRYSQKGPPMAGFCELATSLQAPYFYRPGGENPESLPTHAGLFPFSADRDRRLVSITTAWPAGSRPLTTISTLIFRAHVRSVHTKAFSSEVDTGSRRKRVKTKDQSPVLIQSESIRL
jgi:hypothetical protein